MKNAIKFNTTILIGSAIGAIMLLPVISIKPTLAAPTKKTPKTKPTPKPKTLAQTNVPAIFYDEDWEYRTGTLYGEKKNTVSSVSGDAKFNRDGTYEQNYYIGNIGNFFKGKYKINGNHLVTYDEKGEKVFDFKFTIGTNPKILVLSVFNDDGTKSMDFSLEPAEKKKQ